MLKVHSAAGHSLTSLPTAKLKGVIRVPGDKSISHRALMFGGLAIGETVITGLLEGEDVLATAAALRALGCSVSRDDHGQWRVIGLGLGGMAEPETVLDLGNAGTAARLLMGIVAGHGFVSFMTGDASLCSRPMARVIKPLEQMGARFITRTRGRLPLAVIGSKTLIPIDYELPMPSAQVKSAILLAGLFAPGVTTVIEAVEEYTRDHSENMLRHFGAKVETTILSDGRKKISLTGQPILRAAAVTVPADPSSAAFPAVAAAMSPGSEVTLQGVGINPLRAGVYQSLRDMGAKITEQNQRTEGGEPVADLVIQGSQLQGVTVPANRAPSMIDEYPVLAMAAATAQGTTRLLGLSELRVKESDRLAAVATGLEQCGVKLEVQGDDLIIHGQGLPVTGGATITTNLDHRIAMSFLVLGMRSERPITVDDASPIETSFPGFAHLMNQIGAKIE
ncbi:MAG: 3-phosphoshikimate 1-carboxyvinyltransferase [Candidatus Pacebacteria bacterium]|nr:3-phosphoshikimate 1-carboxyvinyltransferase [Candidatus Paceibacterota bacterium]